TAGLKVKQNEITCEIEAVINEQFDVKRKITLAVKIISVNMKYGDTIKIRDIPGIMDVFCDFSFH
ncbi:MAG TPA: hypothetical protein DHW39_02390, partial [Erysipelotrichaceae bacterium]|nr:hypothetical protein [Erysipelotrichaceae bacterium]